MSDTDRDDTTTDAAGASDHVVITDDLLDPDLASVAEEIRRGDVDLATNDPETLFDEANNTLNTDGVAGGPVKDTGKGRGPGSRVAS